MSKYYYLIAGLPELSLEDNKLNYTMASFREELYPELSKNDREIVDLLYLKFDNKNLLILLKDKSAELLQLGLYTKNELLSLIDTVKFGEEKAKGYVPYLITFLDNYFAEKYEDQVLLEDVLTGMYYEYATQSSNEFVKSWFEYNQIINNLLIALAGRKHQIKYQDHILGSDSISKQIRNSSARDFGLSTVLDYLNSLIRLSDEEDLVQREKRIDQMRWKWMEENTFFNYFTIERIFVFLLQVEMIERWLSLDKDEGNKYFREIISSLQNEVQIPAEFRQNK
ncbi:hypothetical protein Bcop_0876 [Bacteroides coprosuis DSM 18011]|uniref:DUF2764 domain-containing protein n=1 Tax=Bacteroides coprosuis DSM 18011 TaxID=679937 RepID=F3ZTJ8_9BACE|nr:MULTISPECIES: DUF2764 family protein [Bacteroides]EGJ71088.1 hypothetical protein Bcop_0876 [Bacteroides coprosuis DSM 18011]HJD93158.1 DUF2764 domain-containing protein [Bacteroides coprosuis]